MRIWSKIYEISPVWLQNVAISFYGLYWKQRRLGGLFEYECENSKDREKYTKEEWEKYQTEILRKLLIHSFKNVPYYRELWKSMRLTESVLETFTLDRLKELPYLEKEILRKYGSTTLLSECRDKGKFYASSGSTGTPVQIYFSRVFHQKWNALYEVRVRNWAGINYRMRRGMIGGRRVLPDAQSYPPYYRYNYFEKQVYFSAYHLSENMVENYLEGLIRYKVDYLVGYAMSIYFWADFILQKKLKAPELKAVLTSSEKLTSSMRNVIETAFGCKVYDAYSGVEACGLISENAFGELLASPDSGILEVIDKNGFPVKPGETGEVVWTGLLNFDQPLIRYRIGDSVTLSRNQISKSGMYMPVIESIDGRIEDVITGNDGRKMVRFHGLFIDLAGLKSGQVIQHSLGEIEIKLVVDSYYQRLFSEQIITKRLESQLGVMSVSFKYVQDLPRTANGKIKAVISYVKS